MEISGPAYRPVLVLGMLAGVLAVVLLNAGQKSAQSPAPRPVTVAAVSAPLDVLHEWDQRRERAYAGQDARALAALYVPGSTAARSDVRVLGEYSRRGMRIDRLHTQIFSVRVLANETGVLRLRVVDRVAGGVITGRERCLRLPRGHASERTIELRRFDDGWRVASVV